MAENQGDEQGQANEPEESAAEDADIALRLWHTLRPRLREAKASAFMYPTTRYALRSRPSAP